MITIIQALLIDLPSLLCLSDPGRHGGLRYLEQSPNIHDADDWADLKPITLTNNVHASH